MRYRISYVMDGIWERAVEMALDGQADPLATRTLTLDGAIKCVQGRLPPPSVLERFQNLEHLSIANIGVSSLEQFPCLRNLQKLILSDNRIAGGLEFLVQAGLDSLLDLDLSNNRIQYIEDLVPLAQLKLVSLDLYECPVTRVKDYRSRVFGLIKSLKYLDKMDAEENERPESDEDEEGDDEDEDADGEDDPGSCEIDGEQRSCRVGNVQGERMDGIVEVDEEEESDADEEETETGRQINGLNHHQKANGFRVEAVNTEDEEDSDEDNESDSGEEGIDEEDGEDDDDEDDDADVVEVHEIEDSDDEEDGVEDDDGEDEEEVDDDEGDFVEPESNGLWTSTEGEIDGHEQGEDDDDGDGETGEDEQGVGDDKDFVDEEDGEEDEEDCGAGYLVQPVSREHADGVSDMNQVHENDDGEEGEEVEDNDDVDEVELVLPSSSSHLKRKRDDDEARDDDDDDVSDDDIEYSNSKKHH